MKWLLFVPLSALAAFLALAFGAYVNNTGTINLQYRVATSIKAFSALMSLEKKDVKAFIDSYEIFAKDVIAPEDEVKIKDYYRVVNQLCALGEVEKMYVPPVYDLPKGVYGNQLLYEEDMAKTLDVGPGDVLLELGCGRGRISHHVASVTGARIEGMNIAEDQIQNAINYANETGLLGKQLNFRVGSFNDPLPYDDNQFDGFYHVQALTYASDLNKLFAELFRVLKPGSKASFLDWFVLDAYDDTNATQRELLTKTKAIIGGVYSPKARDYITALEKAGFVMEFSKEASKFGHQYPLIQEVRSFFMPVGSIVNHLASIGILTDLAVLLNRLNLYVDDFIESDRLGLFTTSWWIVAQKPPVGPRTSKSKEIIS